LDDRALRIAAMKYALSRGADTLIPPGDFVNFSFAAENIETCLSHPLNGDDALLLKETYDKVKDYPFF
jgi:hypothetical protein